MKKFITSSLVLFLYVFTALNAQTIQDNLLYLPVEELSFLGK